MRAHDGGLSGGFLARLIGSFVGDSDAWDILCVCVCVCLSVVVDDISGARYMANWTLMYVYTRARARGIRTRGIFCVSSRPRVASVRFAAVMGCDGGIARSRSRGVIDRWRGVIDRWCGSLHRRRRRRRRRRQSSSIVVNRQSSSSIARDDDEGRKSACVVVSGVGDACVCVFV